MCEECHTSPHLEGCPNEPEPAVMCECSCCGGEIRMNDTFCRVDGESYCENCFDIEVAQEEED